jgi:glyoxylase-like metal-dependent hydrolase (beta-lactamase superfamily II)
LGKKPEDVGMVVLSHGHADHDGAAHRFAWSQVLIGRQDLRKIADYSGHLQRYEAVVRELLPRWGPPPELSIRIPEFFRHLRRSGDSVPWAEPLDDGCEITGLGPTLRVVVAPGHSEGLICLHRESDSVLFSADQLLEHVIPNPSVYIQDEPPGTGLTDYADSCRRLLSLTVHKVLPGHGPSFTRFEERVKEVLAYEERRQEDALGAVADGTNVYELSRELFPGASGENAYFAFVVLVETFSRLNGLVERGLVESTSEDGVLVYRRV